MCGSSPGVIRLVFVSHNHASSRNPKLPYENLWILNSCMTIASKHDVLMFVLCSLKVQSLSVEPFAAALSAEPLSHLQLPRIDV